MPLTIDEISIHDIYFTSARDHIVHRAMLWRKQYWAFVQGRPYVDTIIGMAEHTMHCSQYLIGMTDKGQDFRQKPIEVEVGFAACLVREF